MRGQAARMRQILNEMLELSRLESSGSADDSTSVDMVALLERIQRDFDKPGETASVVVNAESSRALLGVASEIESVVVNLLSNALRYTPPDGEVSLNWQDSSSGATLTVADNGEGIDPQHLPRLTERFYRVDRGRSRDEGGIGLGLAIVKHVLTRHDAELEIVSEPGTGSEFRCRFPANRMVVGIVGD